MAQWVKPLAAMHTGQPWLRRRGFNSMRAKKSIGCVGVHAIGLNSWTGTEGSPVSSLKCRVRTDSRKLFSRTFQDLQRPNSRVFQDSQNSFSRTLQDKFGSQTWLHKVQRCTHQISYQCSCITVTAFLKFKLTQKVTNCTQHFTQNFSS